MRRILTLAAFAAVLLLAPACASAQIAQIDGRIVATFGGDVDTSAKATNYVLTWNGTKWIAAAASGGSFSPTITTPATGDILRYNGSAWVNVTTSTVLDTVGSTRGSVLYRGASGWAALTPGASGTFLKSNGAGADPSYASAGGGGGFDPASAGPITFGTGHSGDTTITGPTDGDMSIQSGVGRALGVYAGDEGELALVAGGSYTTPGNTPGRALISAGDSGVGSGDAPGGYVQVAIGKSEGSGAKGYFKVTKSAQDTGATIFRVDHDGVLTMTSNSTGAGTPLLGTNCPAVTLTAPYTWQKVITSDGSTGYIAIYK